MSLPSKCRFYRNGLLVASIFCNVGWFLSYKRFPDCIKDAIEHCSINEYNELALGFGEIELYDTIIKHTDMRDYYNGRISLDDLIEKFEKYL